MKLLLVVQAVVGYDYAQCFFMLGIFLTAEAAFREQLSAVQRARLTHLLHVTLLLVGSLLF